MNLESRCRRIVLSVAGLIIYSACAHQPAQNSRISGTPDPYLEAAMEEIHSLRDRWGMIVQRDGDGGDTAQREAMFMVAARIHHNNKIISDQSYAKAKDIYIKNTELLQNSPGIFKRHPDPDQWYSNPKNFSRDQTLPNLIALDFSDQHEVLLDTFLNHIQRGFFFQNSMHNFRQDQHWKVPDFAGPTHLATYIRSLKLKSLYPVLVLTDLILTADVIFHVFFYAANGKNTSNDLNLLIMLSHAQLTLPTPFTYLASKIYSSFRPLAGRYSISNSGPQSALDWYFHPEHGGPPMNYVWEPVIKKHFKPWRIRREIEKRFLASE